eukprot:SAG31_NODE_7652_length_1629_cov_1.811765_2_plen_65_part_01
MNSDGPNPDAWNLRMIAGSYSVSMKFIHVEDAFGSALLENQVEKYLRFGLDDSDASGSAAATSVS